MNKTFPRIRPLKRALSHARGVTVTSMLGMMLTAGAASAQQPGYPPAYYPPGYTPPAHTQMAPVEVPQSVMPPPIAPSLELQYPDVRRASELPARPEEMPPETRALVEFLIEDIREPEIRLDLITRRAKLMRTRFPVVRVAIADPGVVETVNVSPTEFELIGRDEGETTLTLWFDDPNQPGQQQVLRYLVKVSRDFGDEDARRVEYGELQKRINELFPNSYVQLIPVADKLIVKGQARDAQEATRIMGILRDEAVDQSGALLGPGSFYGVGFNYGGGATRLYGATDQPTSSIINMLDVPGEQQVLLKVRVAELTRGALREMGADFAFQTGDFNFQSNLNFAGAFQAVLNSTDVQFALSALASNRTTKVLAEPNLVTLSGYPASFIAGGQFAVPTVVGVDGVGAATTHFQGFGTQLYFTPTVLDKDRVRLQVSPTLSEVVNGADVGGIPSLRTRSVFTTVDLREGQWLAIAGLLQDTQDGDKARVPILGDIPIVDTLFSHKRVTRDETELVILVSPELIHPLEPEQAPLILPGMEVTEPDDWHFYALGHWEGHPDQHHRSTIWPLYPQRILAAKHQAMREAKQHSHYLQSESYYVNGPHGFSY